MVSELSKQFRARGSHPLLCLLVLPVLFLILLMASTVTGKEGDIPLTPEEQQWIEQNPVIRVANETDWPPFDFAENGVAVGYSIDLIKSAAKKVGLKYEFVNGFTWDELLEMGRERRVDVFPAIWKNSDREEFLTFTKPYI